jgi:hypothetical protein
MIDELDNVPLLYSVGTLLAYKIAKRYYKKHYVWCTIKFDSKTQPVTSNPLTICRRYLEQIITSDRHTVEIDKNKVGILTGAKRNYDDGLISKDQYEKIKNIVACAEYESFFPVIYIIYTERVKHKCIKVKKEECASDTSLEYKIESLEEGEFNIISLYDILYGIIDFNNRGAGV